MKTMHSSEIGISTESFFLVMRLLCRTSIPAYHEDPRPSVTLCVRLCPLPLLSCALIHALATTLASQPDHCTPAPRTLQTAPTYHKQSHLSSNHLIQCVAWPARPADKRRASTRTRLSLGASVRSPVYSCGFLVTAYRECSRGRVQDRPADAPAQRTHGALLSRAIPGPEERYIRTQGEALRAPSSSPGSHRYTLITHHL